MSARNLIGEKFGQLTVVGNLGVKDRYTMWRCRCSCGNEVEVPTYKLTREITRSCGCSDQTKSDSEKVEEAIEENWPISQGVTPCSWYHKDCFALCENGKCNALSDTYFPGRKKCPFYKPKHKVVKELYG